MSNITPINAYKAGLTNLNPSLGQIGAESLAGPKFGDFMKDAVANNVAKLHKFETAVHASTTGHMSELDLVTAINETDIQLQAFKVAWEKFLQEFKGIVEKTAL
jgi:hypothetical protein